MVNVSWTDAKTYAQWAGKRLPDEDEWEYAARGPANRIYPWGNEWDSRYANLKESGRNEAVAVGSYPEGKSWCGANDMAGNVAEWVGDEPKPYPTSALKFDSRVRVFRGGAYDTSKDDLVTTNRPYDLLGQRELTVGFRCAKNAPKH